MAANKKFTPRASANLIEDEVTDAKKVPEDVKAEDVKEDTVPSVEEVKTASEVSTPEVTEDEPEQLTMTLEATETKEDTPKEETKKSKSDEEESVVFTAKTESTPIERMVKVRLAKKYDGCIGGIRYHFNKDEVVNVPENVKRILNSAEGMLKPL